MADLYPISNTSSFPVLEIYHIVFSPVGRRAGVSSLEVKYDIFRYRDDLLSNMTFSDGFSNTEGSYASRFYHWFLESFKSCLLLLVALPGSVDPLAQLLA